MGFHSIYAVWESNEKRMLGIRMLKQEKPVVEPAAEIFQNYD